MLQPGHLKSLKTTLARAQHHPRPCSPDYQSIATPTTMPPRATKKRARASDAPTTSTKRSRISPAPPLTPEPSQTWERQQLESQPQESIAAPTKSGSHASHAGTELVATTEAAGDNYIDNGGENYDGLDWDRLGSRYIKPLA
jgi:hypothetical protein